MPTDEEYIPEICKVSPLDTFMSTDLNNKIKSYDDLTDRILHFFGWPSISIPDLHRDQIWDAISMATERFIRWAGTTKEYLIFDSRLYQPNHGIPIDKLCTISGIMSKNINPDISYRLSKGPEQPVKVPDDVYVTKTYIKMKDYFVSFDDYKILSANISGKDLEEIKMLFEMSKRHPNGIEELSIISKNFFEYLINKRGYSPDMFKKSKDTVFTVGGEKQELYTEDENGVKDRDKLQYNKMYDYDIMDYRKIQSVTGYNELQQDLVSTMFNFDSILAQQFFYANQFNQKSFGLTAWYALHEWRNLYEKLLCTKRGFSFNPSTQYLTLTPQPRPHELFYAVVECWVEKPLKDVIREPWVLDYAKAICKEILGRTRGRWEGVSYLGGGSLTGNQLAAEGVQQQKDLMTELMQNQAYGAQGRPRFFVG